MYVGVRCCQLILTSTKEGNNKNEIKQIASHSLFYVSQCYLPDRIAAYSQFLLCDNKSVKIIYFFYDFLALLFVYTKF